MRCPLREYENDLTKKNILGLSPVYIYFTNQTIEWYINQKINRPLNSHELAYVINSLDFFRIIPKEFACKEFINYINSHTSSSIWIKFKSFEEIIIDYAKSIIPDLTDDEIKYIGTKRLFDMTDNLCYTYFDLERDRMTKVFKIKKERENL